METGEGDAMHRTTVWYYSLLLTVIDILKAEGAKDGIQFFIMGRAFSPPIEQSSTQSRQSAY